jgi:hypothetical protein
MGGKTDGASLVAYLDIARAFTTYYNTLAPVATVFKDMLRGDGTGVDLMKLPLGETIGKYLGQTVHKVSVEPDGLRVDGISASGTTLMTAVYAGAAAIIILPAVRAGRGGHESSPAAGRSRRRSTSRSSTITRRRRSTPTRPGAEFFKQLKELEYLAESPPAPSRAARTAGRRRT